MGFFDLGVKGLWCGALYVAIVIFADSVIPGRITEFALHPLGILMTLALFAYEIIFDYVKAPDWVP